MMDPVQAMLAAGVIPTDGLPPTSRYVSVGTATRGIDPNTLVYYRRRLVPAAERHPLLRHLRLTEGDRRDLIAHVQLGDAALWWRLADAADVLDPRDIEGPPGRWIRITLAADSAVDTEAAIGDA